MYLTAARVYLAPAAEFLPRRRWRQEAQMIGERQHDVAAERDDAADDRGAVERAEHEREVDSLAGRCH